MSEVTIISNAVDDWDYEGYYIDGKLVIDGNPDEPEMIVILLEKLGHSVIIHDLTNDELTDICNEDGSMPEEVPKIIPSLRNTVITK